MKILVTGASGYVGGNLAAWLKENTDSWVIGTYNSRLPQIVLDEKISCNLADCGVDNKLYSVECDAIIHVAGCFNADSIYGYINNNIKATENILAYAQKKSVKKFIYISTTSIYGETLGEVSENSDKVNLSDYGMTKKICERMVEEAAIESRLILRLSSTLGGYDNDYTRPWLPKVAYKMLHNMDVSYYNPNLGYNAVVYVKDVAKYIFRFISEGKVGCYDYILASNGPMTILEILDLLKMEIGSKSNLIKKDISEANRCYAINIEKAVKDGFEACTVKEVIKYFARDVLCQENKIDFGDKV